MPRILRFQIDASYDGRKVVHFLRGEAGLSARLVQSLKRLPDGICLNGAPTRTIDQLCEGDELTLRLPDDLNRVEPLELPLDIRYEDDDLLILNKPAGLAMHPTHNHQGDTLANAVAAYFQEQGRQCVMRCVGRLDRDTSGIVLCALNRYAAARLSGRVEKEYLAVVSGLYRGSGTIDRPIIRPNPDAYQPCGWRGWIAGGDPLDGGHAGRCNDAHAPALGNRAHASNTCSFCISRHASCGRYNVWYRRWPNCSASVALCTRPV